MAIDDKLKKLFRRSRSPHSNDTPASTTHAPNRARKRSSRLFQERPSKEYQHARETPIAARSQAALGDSQSDFDQSTPSHFASGKDDLPDQSTAPGLHNPNYKLPQVPRGRDFSSDFNGLTTSSQDGYIPTQLDEGRNSVHIADRNLTAASGNPPTLRMVPSQDQERPQSRSQPSYSEIDPYSSNVADWNMVRNDDPAADMRVEAPSPLKVKKRNSNLHQDEPPQGSTLKTKPSEIRDASWSVTPLAMEGDKDESPLDVRGKISALNSDIPVATDTRELPTRSSLDKPLPPTPRAMMSHENAPSTTFQAAPHNNCDELSESSQQNPAGPFNLDGVDVEKQPDTVSLHERQAQPVTHETIKREEHVTRQEVITRETHEHHIYHRILPIIDIEVKPARHFVPVQDGFVEIDEEELPGRTRDKVNWAIAEMVSKRTPPETQQASARRRFTACTFKGTEFDDKEYIGPEGHPVKEKWWVHPPTLCQDAYRAGQTYPFHFGSEKPEDDGLKAKLPAGNVIGVSRRMMEKRQKEAKESEQSMLAAV